MSRKQQLRNTADFFLSNKIGAVLPVDPGKKGIQMQGWQEYNSSKPYSNLQITETHNYTVVNDPKIIVLDVDTKKITDEVTKKAYEKALFEYDIIKNTLVIKTPSGGYHIYYKVQNKTALKAKFHWNEKTKANEGVLSIEPFPDLNIIDLPLNAVMPGSVYNGNEYTFINQVKPLIIDSIHDLPILADHNADKTGQCFYDIFKRFGLSKYSGHIEEGSRNTTIYSIGLSMASSGIEKNEAINIFNYRYLDKFQGTIQPIEIDRTFSSAYKRTEENDTDKKLPKEVITAQYLHAQEWQFRENIIKEQKETKKGVASDWEPYDLYTPSALAFELSFETKKSSFLDPVKLFIRSQCMKNKFHAGEHFLNHVERQKETDYIKEFTQALKTDVNQDLLYWTLRRWFLESLYTLSGQTLENSKANRTCLVFQGKQKIGKTGLAKIMVPGPLKSYYYLGDITHNRDFATLISDNCFIILDDIDNMDYAERKNLKSLITQTSVKNRKAYAEEATNRKAIANFIATTNQKDVLSDITGNTRYFPISITAIDWDTIDPVEGDFILKLWGQAADDYDNGRLKEIKEETEKFNSERDDHVKMFEQKIGPEETLEMYFTGVEPEGDDYELTDKVEVTVNQIIDTFLFFYPSLDKRAFSSRMVGNVLTKMQCETRKTKRHRLRTLYLYRNTNNNLVKTLLDWYDFNVNGGIMPNLSYRNNDIEPDKEVTAF